MKRQVHRKDSLAGGFELRVRMRKFIAHYNLQLQRGLKHNADAGHVGRDIDRGIGRELMPSAIVCDRSNGVYTRWHRPQFERSSLCIGPYAQVGLVSGCVRHKCRHALPLCVARDRTGDIKDAFQPSDEFQGRRCTAGKIDRRSCRDV